MTDALNSFRQQITGSNEKFLLGVYFIVIMILASELTVILQGAWIRGHLVKAIFGLRHFFDLRLSVLSVFLLGIFFGLVLLMAFDPMKRVQGTLLVIGTIAAGVIMLQANFLFDNIRVDTVGYLLGGIGLGVILGGGTKLLRLDQVKNLQFRRASRGIYLVFILLLIFGLFEYHVNYPNVFQVSIRGVALQQPDSLSIGFRTDRLVRNAAVSAGFVYTLRRFIQYDSKRKYFVLGPRSSGKSMFMLGTYLEAQRQAETSGAGNRALNPSEDMAEMIGNLDKADNSWPEPATDTNVVRDLSLTHTAGNVFPINLEINLIDYAGEQLQQIPEAIEDIRMGNAGGMDPTVRRLAEGAIEADTLILTIDVERFVNDESIDAEAYFGILEQTGATKTILVATKSDLLADRFREQEKLDYYEEWELFTDFVNAELRKSEQVKALIAQSTAETIYPVGVQTKESEDGEIVPMMAQGSFQVEGYRELLEALE